MSALVQDAGGVDDLADAMASGSLTATALVERCLARIEAVDPVVKAFIHVRFEEARSAARGLDLERAAGRVRGPLHGIPVAVKDVIDVAGLPTHANSASRADAPPATADATVVAHLRAAGAIILGKVHTTEYAYFESVPPTRNPHDPSRTPGGSSAGSAAAVAAGMTPLALGTQTAGSVNRPAAYCGIGAFKPSTLAIGGIGTVPFAPSFDTVGGFGASAADAARLVAGFAADHLGLDRPDREAQPARIHRIADPLIDGLLAPSCGAAMDDLAARLAEAGAPVSPLAAPVSLAEVLAAHRVVLLAELGRTHARVDRTLVAPRLAADIDAGLSISEADYHAALRRLAGLRRAFWQAIDPADMVLLPAAPDVAPVGMATGDPSFVIPATALGGPIAGLRCGLVGGLPFGAMLMDRPGRDARLVGFLWSQTGRRLGL